VLGGEGDGSATGGKAEECLMEGRKIGSVEWREQAAGSCPALTASRLLAAATCRVQGPIKEERRGCQQLCHCINSSRRPPNTTHTHFPSMTHHPLLLSSSPPLLPSCLSICASMPPLMLAGTRPPSLRASRRRRRHHDPRQRWRGRRRWRQRLAGCHL
jgi:hypothetical protein